MPLEILFTAFDFYTQIGGGKFAEKANALQVLASVCDGLVFIGSMAFQIMYALGIPVPLDLVEPGILKEAVDLIEFAKARGTQIIFPKDIWCVQYKIPDQKKLFSVECMVEGKAMVLTDFYYSCIME